MPAVSGSPTQIASSVQTTADLAGLPDDAFKSGDLAFVEALQPAGHFELIRSTGAVPPGGIPAFSGNGYWLQLPCSIVSVANIAELAAYPDAGLPNGAWAYVVTLRDYFQKIVQSPVAPLDGVVRVPTASGDGDWYRMGIASPTWADEHLVGTTATWYLDSSSGNDENDGSISSPLATVAELSRRLVYLRRSVTYLVNALEAVGASDLLYLSNRIFLTGSGTNTAPVLYFLGTKTTVSTGTASAVNQSDPSAGATGTQASITDSLGGAWTPGSWVYLQDGKGAHVLKDLGAGVARLGHFFTPGNPVTGTNTRSTSVSVGTYSVVTKTAWNAPVSGGDSDLTLIFKDFDFGAITDRTNLFPDALRAVLMFECNFPTTNAAQGLRTLSRNSNFNSCFFGNGATSFDTAINSIGVSFSLCSFLGTDLAFVVGSPSLACTLTNLTFQGVGGVRGCLRIGQSTQSSPTTVQANGWLSFYDWSTSTAAISIDAEARLVGVSATQLNVWGTGGTYSVRVKNGGVLLLPAGAGPSAAPYVKIQGSTQDIDLDGLSGASGSATAPMPVPTPGAPSTLSNSVALNGANGAGWTAWQGSFGRKAISHLTGAKIYASV